MKKPEFLIGVDIGGSHVTGGLVGRKGFALSRGSLTRLTLDTNGPQADVLDGFAKAILGAAANDLSRVAGIGFAFPGPFDWANGVCLITPEQNKFRNLYRVNIRQELQKRLAYKGPIGFVNDAAAFGIGEYAAGAARGASKVLALTLGTGFGASFLADGKPVIAGPSVPPPDGELWHVAFEKGIADDAFSTRGLVAAWKAASGETLPGAKEIDALARGGDSRAERLFTEFGTRLGMFLAPWIHSFGVETLVLGGNIAKSLDLFNAGLRGVLGETLAVKLSVLGEDAQIVGAAAAAARS